MAPAALALHSHNTTPIFLGFTSTHSLSPQMDLTDARCASCWLEALCLQEQQSQRDHHETEQMLNDVFHAPTTRGRGESPTTQEPEAGSHHEKGKHTLLGQFCHSQHTRVLTSCGDVEAEASENPCEPFNRRSRLKSLHLLWIQQLMRPLDQAG